MFTAPIVTSQATVSTMNGTAVNQYFSVLDVAANLPISVDFGAPVTIKGNLVSDKLLPATTLQKLSNDSIARLGSTQVTMDSPIIFKERLLVNHIEMDTDTNGLVRKSLNTIDDGRVIRKEFKRLTVSGNIIMPNNVSIIIRNFNEYNSLKNGLDSMITTLDRSSAQLISQSPVIFEQVCNAQTVNVENANFIETIQQIEQHYDLNAVLQNVTNVRAHSIEPLLIDGNVRFAQHPELNNNSQHVSILNGLELSGYLERVILTRVDQKTCEISGEKTFISELNITSAHMLEINKRIQTNKWFEDAFRRQQIETHAQQTIESTGWQFNDVTSDNFNIHTTINGVQVVLNENDSTAKRIIFVDDNASNRITIVSDISISNDAIIGSNSQLDATELRPCNVLPLIPPTVHLMQRTWNEVNVIGNVKVLNKETNTKQCASPFCYFEMALLSETEETINTNIVFNLIDKHDKFSFNQIIMWSTNATTLMNNINLQEIFNDAITRTPVIVPSNGDAVLTFNAAKELIGSETIFNVSDAYATNAITANLINNININYLNQTLYLRSTTSEMFVLKWQKFLFLDPPQVQIITISNQSINGVDVSTILFAYSNQSASLSFQKEINDFTTKSTSSSIDSGSIYVSTVNGISFEYFIDNRCRLSNNPYAANSPQTIDGYYTFEQLILTGNDVAIEQINDVPCDELVLKQSNDKQLITGDKRIAGDSRLFIEKPVHAWRVNDFEFVSTFAESIRLDHQQSIGRIQQQSPYQLNARRAYVRLR